MLFLDLKLVAENGEQHIEYILLQSHEILKPIRWIVFLLFLASELLKTDLFGDFYAVFRSKTV